MEIYSQVYHRAIWVIVITKFFKPEKQDRRQSKNYDVYCSIVRRKSDHLQS